VVTFDIPLKKIEDERDYFLTGEMAMERLSD